MVTCEVCVEGYSGAWAAAEGGAHRVELCAGLVEGGTTPSQGAIGLSVERLEIPTMVLIRPRGGDFLYSHQELDTMLRDISLAGEIGAFGIATGALTRDGRVDEEAMGRIRDAAGSMSLTFHRAFDMVRDPMISLETLIELRVDRVLTSGGEGSVPEALDSLQALVEKAADRISIMPGGAVREENIWEIVEKTGVREIHFTAFSRWESPMGFRNPRPYMGSASVPGEYERIGTDPEEVRRIMGALAEGR